MYIQAIKNHEKAHFESLEQEVKKLEALQNSQNNGSSISPSDQMYIETLKSQQATDMIQIERLKIEKAEAELLATKMREEEQKLKEHPKPSVPTIQPVYIAPVIEVPRTYI